MRLEERLEKAAKAIGLDAGMIEASYYTFVGGECKKAPILRIHLSDIVERCGGTCERFTFADICIIKDVERWDGSVGDVAVLCGVFHGRFREGVNECTMICIGAGAMRDASTAIEDDENVELAVSIIMSQLGGRSACATMIDAAWREAARLPPE